MALHERLRLAESLAPHEIDILELSDTTEPNLTKKFKATMERVEAVVVWLPMEGKLSTVFGELLLLRYEETWHGKRVTIFAEEGVLGTSEDKFRVLHQHGQIAFLLDLPKFYDLEVFEYETSNELVKLLEMYADGLLGS